MCCYIRQKLTLKFYVAVAVFKFTRKKTIVLLDALVSFRTFIYLDRAIRMSHSKQFLFFTNNRFDVCTFYSMCSKVIEHKGQCSLQKACTFHSVLNSKQYNLRGRVGLIPV